MTLHCIQIADAVIKAFRNEDEMLKFKHNVRTKFWNFKIFKEHYEGEGVVGQVKN